MFTINVLNAQDFNLSTCFSDQDAAQDLECDSLVVYKRLIS